MIILGTKNDSPVITIYLTRQDAFRLIKSLAEIIEYNDRGVRDFVLFNAETSVIPGSLPSKDIGISIGYPE